MFIKGINKRIAQFKRNKFNLEYTVFCVITYITTVAISLGFALNHRSMSLLLTIAILFYPLWGFLCVFGGIIFFFVGIVCILALVITILGLKMNNVSFVNVVALLVLSVLPIFVGIECTKPFLRP
jgi:hypothetical protein